MDQIRYTYKTKDIIWHPKTQEEIKSFPKEVRKELGYLLYLLQQGEKLSMPYSKPMPSISKGVAEIRVRSMDGSYRVFYYLKYSEAILVFHCFKKKDQKTPLTEMKQAIKNLKDLL